MPGLDLVADCDRCVGLCCVLLPFQASAGFGADKPGGQPCGNLDPWDRCRIHGELAETGWTGCVAFDCFGAGQQVTQVTYGGRSWSEQDNLAEMGAVFTVMRELHGMLLRLDTIHPLYAELLALTAEPPEVLLMIDLDGLADRLEAVVTRRPTI